MARALRDCVDPTADDFLVEYCAGSGALTELFIGAVGQLRAVEIDERMIPHLERLAERAGAGAELEMACADAIGFDLGAIGRPVRVVGNLAYNVSVPILLDCLRQLPQIIDAHFMLQREVAERISAAPGQRAYGRLAVVMQAWFEARIVKRVPPECFSPRPKVHSAFLRLRPRAEPLLDHQRCQEFQDFVRKAFAMRRKSLANNLRAHYPLPLPKIAAIDGKRRAQELSPKELASLFQLLRQPSQ